MSTSPSWSSYGSSEEPRMWMASPLMSSCPSQMNFQLSSAGIPQGFVRLTPGGTWGVTSSVCTCAHRDGGNAIVTRAMANANTYRIGVCSFTINSPRHTHQSSWTNAHTGQQKSVNQSLLLPRIAPSIQGMITQCKQVRLLAAMNCAWKHSRYSPLKVMLVFSA